MQHMRGARKLLDQRLEVLLGLLVRQVPVLAEGVLGPRNRELIGQHEGAKALDEETLMRELKPWVLGGGTLRDILKRRDKIVAQFDRFVSEKGEAAVFPF